jgi:DNA-directed RNA polymerase subunit RPC12/RpoP
VAQWNKDLNGDLTPDRVLCNSGRKVWWTCNEGHAFDARIADMNNRKVGCPYCSGKRVSPENCLAVKRPDLVGEWHPSKNGKVTPVEVSYGSGKKVWWLCKKDINHEWQSKISDRVRGNNCPYCSGKKVSSNNSLATVNPEIAKEWHPTKNKNLTPNDVTSCSGISVWWKCEKGHEWKSKVSNRKWWRNCPECTKELHTSFPEQAIFFYCKKLFPDAQSGHKINGYEVDVFIPSLFLAIEYDGVRYHKSETSEERDLKKNHELLTNGIRLIRVREIGLPVMGLTVVRKDKVSLSSLKGCILELFGLIQDNYVLSEEQLSLLSEMKRKDIKEDVTNIYSYITSSKGKNSLLLKNPELAKQWNYERNGNLRPEHVSFSSHKTVWWKCEKCGHEWQDLVMRRKNGNKCPICPRKNRWD